jgi:hypothetical protein
MYGQGLFEIYPTQRRKDAKFSLGGFAPLRVKSCFD